jgi:hypothetical protein
VRRAAAPLAETASERLLPSSVAEIGIAAGGEWNHCEASISEIMGVLGKDKSRLDVNVNYLSRT